MVLRVGVYGKGQPVNEVVRIIGALDDISVTKLGSWRKVHQQGEDLNLLVFVILEGQATALERLARGRVGFFPRRPVILVTNALERVALYLHAVRIDQVVQVDRMETEIPAAIDKTRMPTILDQAARRVEQADHLPKPVSQFIIAALRSPKPLIQVNQVLRRVQVSSPTLHRHWRRCIPTAQPKEFLDWVLLMSAVHRKSYSDTWSKLALDLGVSRHTLRRAALRRTSLGLVDLNRTKVRRKFERFIRTTLFKGRDA